MPDGKAGEIIREQIQPGFKAGDYYGGFAAGVNSIISTITPDYKSGYSGSTSQNKNRDQSFPFAFIVAIIIFIFSFLGNINRGARIITVEINAVLANHGFGVEGDSEEAPEADSVVEASRVEVAALVAAEAAPAVGELVVDGKSYNF